MAEALGYRGDGDSGGKHLGGHEVPQVVEPKCGSPAVRRAAMNRFVTLFGSQRSHRRDEC